MHPSVPATGSQVGKAAFWIGARDTLAVTVGTSCGGALAYGAFKLVSSGALPGYGALGLLSVPNLAFAIEAGRGWAASLDSDGYSKMANVVRYGVPLAVLVAPFITAAACGGATPYLVGRFVFANTRVVFRAMVGQTIGSAIPSLKVKVQRDGQGAWEEADSKHPAIWKAQGCGVVGHIAACELFNFYVGGLLPVLAQNDFANEMISRGAIAIITEGLFEGPMSVVIQSRCQNPEAGVQVVYQEAKGTQEVAKNLREIRDTLTCTPARPEEQPKIKTCASIVATAASRLVWSFLPTIVSVVSGLNWLTELVRGMTHVRKQTGEVIKDGFKLMLARQQPQPLQEIEIEDFKNSRQDLDVGEGRESKFVRLHATSSTTATQQSSTSSTTATQH